MILVWEGQFEGPMVSIAECASELAERRRRGHWKVQPSQTQTPRRWIGDEFWDWARSGAGGGKIQLLSFPASAPHSPPGKVSNSQKEDRAVQPHTVLTLVTRSLICPPLYPPPPPGSHNRSIDIPPRLSS